MTRYRSALPQLSGDPFLTDGGIETTLIFHEGIDLPDFAAFPLLFHDAGRAALRRYFRPYVDLAFQHDTASSSKAPLGAPTPIGPGASATPAPSSPRPIATP